MLAGMLVGPRTGFAIGCLTDIMVFVLRPPGMFFPGFTLTQGLTAMLPGLMTRGREPLTGQPLTRGGFQPSGVAPWRSFARLVGIFGVTQLITSVLMVSYFTSELIGIPLELELAKRAFYQCVHVPIYAALGVALLLELSETESYTSLLRARR